MVNLFNKSKKVKVSREVSFSDSGDTEQSDRSQVGHLVLSQTIGVVAVACLVVASLHSARVQALVSSTRLGVHVLEWIVSKLSTVGPLDILSVVVMVGLMIGWTVAVQWVFARGGPVSQAEWRPGVSGGTWVALYLVVAASVVEEIVFRGIVLSAASYYLGTFGGLAMSAVVFGLLHFEKGPLGQLVAVGYGVILGSGLLWGSSLFACIVAHAGGNALAFFLPERFVGAGRSGEGR